MLNYILLGVYIFVVLGIFWFLAVFMMHIRDYQKYSRYIPIVTRIYMILMILVALFGGYYILVGTIFPQSQKSIQRINL